VRLFVRDTGDSETGGSFKAHRFIARFRALTRDDVEAAAGDADTSWLERILAGWDEVAGADGKPLAFTPENLTRLLARPGVAAAVAEAYRRALTGEEFARKN